MTPRNLCLCSNPACSMQASTSLCRLLNVSTTPLGSPLVPLVYISTAMSSGLGFGRRVFKAASASPAADPDAAAHLASSARSMIFSPGTANFPLSCGMVMIVSIPLSAIT